MLTAFCDFITIERKHTCIWFKSVEEQRF